MSTGLVIALVILAVLVVGAIAAYVYFSKKRTEQLRDRFGPEYERTVGAAGRSEGEKELRRREERVSKLQIRDLPIDERRRFSEEWRNVQAHFVDAPADAIGEADELVQRVMAKRGYPVSDFEQRAADISVDHPEVVNNYRQGHAIAEKHARDGASTEDLRQAMVNYRSLFAELLGEPTDSAMTRRSA